MAALDDPSLEPEVKAIAESRGARRAAVRLRKKEHARASPSARRGARTRRTPPRPAPPRARSRARVRGGVRGDGRGAAGAIPADARFFFVGAAPAASSRRRRPHPRERGLDVQPPVRGRLAQAPRGATTASRKPGAGSRAKPRRGRPRRASALRASAIAREGTESLLTETGVLSPRAQRALDDGARPTTQKRRVGGARSAAARARCARARRGRSRGAAWASRAGRVGVALPNRLPNSTARASRRPRFATTKRRGADDEPAKRRSPSPRSCARRRSRAATAGCRDGALRHRALGGSRWSAPAVDAADVRARRSTDFARTARSPVEQRRRAAARPARRRDDLRRRSGAQDEDRSSRRKAVNARLEAGDGRGAAADSRPDESASDAKTNARRLRRRRRPPPATLAPVRARERAWETERRRPARIAPSGVLVVDTRPELARPFATRSSRPPTATTTRSPRSPRGCAAPSRTRAGIRAVSSARRLRARANASAFAESVFTAAPPDAWAAEWMSARPDPRDTAEGEGEGDTPAAAPAPTLESVAEEVARALRLPSAGTTPGRATRANAETFAKSRDALVVPRRRRGARAGRARVDAAAVSEREAHAAPGDARRRNRRRRRGPEDAPRLEG